jgi:hypothetical protein
VAYINVGQIADRSVYVAATTDTNVLTYPPHSRSVKFSAGRHLEVPSLALNAQSLTNGGVTKDSRAT